MSERTCGLAERGRSVGVACDASASVVETGKCLEDSNLVIGIFDYWYMQIL